MGQCFIYLWYMIHILKIFQKSPDLVLNSHSCFFFFFLDIVVKKLSCFVCFLNCTQGLPSTATDSGRGKVLSDAPLHSPAASCQSDSFMSNASYPLTQPAQRQRRLNSTSNLRRSRFNAPCFGLLSGTSESSKAQTNGITSPNTLSDTSGALASQLQVKGQISSVEDDHVTVPVFAISEEEDRQPLVSAEHPEKPLRMNGQMYEGTKMPLLSKSQAPSIQPSSLARGGHGGALETQDPSALSC